MYELTSIRNLNLKFIISTVTDKAVSGDGTENKTNSV